MLSEERSDEFIFATQRAVVFAVTFSQPCIFFCFFSLFQEKEKKGKTLQTITIHVVSTPFTGQYH
jgi:hypothetical protein